MSRTMLFFATMTALVATPAARAQSVDRPRTSYYGSAEQAAPAISVWIDRYSFRAGERMRAYFQTDPGAYVTILRIATSGDVRVLYPRTPSLQQSYSSDRVVDDEVPYSNQAGFYLNEPEGVGFVFAIASFEPFDYRAYTSGGQWSTYALTANRYADPFATVNSFVAHTLSLRAEYSSDYIRYEIIGRGRYQSGAYVYSSYRDQYYRCLSLYGARADGYCRSYSEFGYAPLVYAPIIVGRLPGRSGTPSPLPSGGKKGSGGPKAPHAFVPDPVMGEEGLKPTPTQRSTENRDAQRVFGEMQRREGTRRGDRTQSVPSSARSEPTVAPAIIYRSMPSAPRIDVRPESRPEMSQPRGYEPLPHSDPQPRYQPQPVQRSEPQRIEYHPAPQPPPPPPAPVYRDPAPREVHPAPPPPPAPSERHGGRKG